MPTETVPRPDEPGDLSTLPSEPAARWSSYDKWLRRLAVFLIAAASFAALLGLLGVRTATVSATASGYSLEVHFARVSRAGLETPFTVDVRSDSGRLPPTFTLLVDTAYLSILDENGLDPQPSSAFADSVQTEWIFEVPGDQRELSVDFDARLSPAVQWGRSGWVALVVDGEEVARVDFETWVMP